MTLADLGTYVAIGGGAIGALGAVIPVIRWMMYMAKEAGVMTSRLEHITTFCDEMKAHWSAQSVVNTDHGERLTKVEGQVGNHGEELKRHHHELLEIKRQRGRHDG